MNLSDLLSLLYINWEEYREKRKHVRAFRKIWKMGWATKEEYKLFKSLTYEQRERE